MKKNETLDILDIYENLTFLKILDIFENFGHFGQLKNHSKAQKSEVISDRQTDIVNHRVALTRLKKRVL